MALLKTSDDLLHALEDATKEPLVLRAGDGDNPAIYELEWQDTRPTFVNLSGTNLPYNQVWLYKTFPVAYYSIWNNLMAVPKGDFAAFNLDLASYSKFNSVWVRSQAEKGQSHFSRRRWSEVEKHEGVGWEVTSKNNGDSSYKVRFTDCHVEYARIGFDIQKAGVKGTVKWRLEECTLDSCEIGIKAFNAGEMKIDGGNIQLSKTALWFDHCSNVQIDFINTERGETDILVSPDSHEITATNARLTAITDPAQRLRLKVKQGHRNVDSYRSATLLDRLNEMLGR